jgi:hypothetical protein
LTLVAVIGIGIASRLGARHLPSLIGKEFGDALWSVMFFLLVLLAWPKVSTLTAASLALAVSFAIECLKLVHGPWMDALRADRVAGFLLGHAFLWRDFVSYGLGTLAAAVGDLLTSRRS